MGAYDDAECGAEHDFVDVQLSRRLVRLDGDAVETEDTFSFTRRENMENWNDVR
jgi:hypothetical protein